MAQIVDITPEAIAFSIEIATYFIKYVVLTPDSENQSDVCHMCRPGGLVEI